MLHSSAKQNSLFYFRMAGGYTRKSYCSKKTGIPGYMEFPTQDIFRHEMGTFNEYLCSLTMLYADIAFLISHAYMMVNCPEHFRGGAWGWFNLVGFLQPVNHHSGASTRLKWKYFYSNISKVFSVCVVCFCIVVFVNCSIISSTTASDELILILGPG